MNTNLLNILKQVAASQGEAILSDPRRLQALFSDLAKDEPKNERVAFGRCVETGAYQKLKGRNIDDRYQLKKALADQMHTDTGIDKTLCVDALDLLDTVMFGEGQVRPAAKEAEVRQTVAQRPIAHEITSSSGSVGYGVEQIKPVTTNPQSQQATEPTSAKTNTEKLTGGQNAILVLVAIGLSGIYGLLTVLLVDNIDSSFVFMVIFVVYVAFMVLCINKLGKHFINKNKSANKER